MEHNHEEILRHLADCLLGETCREAVTDPATGLILIPEGQKIRKVLLRQIAQQYPEINLSPGWFANEVTKAVSRYEKLLRNGELEKYWDERYGNQDAEWRSFSKKWDETYDSALGLSTRSANRLFSMRVFATKDAILNAFESCQIEQQRGIGLVTENELRKAVGLPEKEAANPPWKFDPWTGEPIPPEQQRKRTRPRRKA